MREVDEVSTYEALLRPDRARWASAYLHVLIDPDDAAVRRRCARCGQGSLVLNTGRDGRHRASASWRNFAEWGVISAAAVGRAFLANPDLIERLALGAELNEPDVATFYAPGPVGYIDYPTLADSEQLSA